MQPFSLVLTVIPHGRTALQPRSHEAEHVPEKKEEEEEEEEVDCCHCFVLCVHLPALS